jgi:histidinol phosphatase-like PHP family hydrolase
VPALAHLDHDLHIHTYLSSCCQEKERHRPGAILALAEEMGVKTIGFADHVWVNPALEPSNWYRPQDESQIARLREDLSSVLTNVRVLVGCEAEMIGPGKIGLTPAFAETLDFVLLACSHFHMKGFMEQPKSDAPGDIGAHLIRFFSAAVTSGIATAIPHPLMPLGYLDQYDATIAALSDQALLDAFGLAREHNVAIEVTTSFLPPPTETCFSLEAPIRVLSLAKQAGCLFTFATDAHAPESQRRLPELKCIVEAVGITDQDLLLQSPAWT